MRRTVQDLFLFTAVGALLTAAPAIAQEVKEPTTTAVDTAGRLDVVTITATRSGATDLQVTPIAVTSISGEDLETRNIDNLQDVASYVPSLSIGARAGFGSGFGNVSLRGMGVDAQESSQAVGTYIDDVFYSSNYGNILGLMDVERVEVLRGPQGTLFGRNTIAGAIQYVTRAPENEFGGYLTATAGNLDRGDLAGALNIPLGDNFAIRLSGEYNEVDGYVRDDLNGVNRGAVKSTPLRLRARWTPTDSLTVDLKAETAKTETNGRPALIPLVNPTSLFPVLAAAFGAPGVLSNANISSNFKPGDFSTQGYNDPDYSESETTVYQGTVAYELNDTMTLKSITSQMKTDAFITTDFDSTPLDILAVYVDDSTKAFTQEFQLLGKAADDRLKYTLGAFYFDSDRRTISPNAIGPNPFDLSVGTTVSGIQSYAVYGQASFDVTENLTLAAGVRYTDEKTSSTIVDANTGFIPGPTPGVPAPGSFAPLTFPTTTFSFTDWSPYFGVNYSATDDIFLFAKASKGFRAGGFTSNKALAGGGRAFDPETAWTYELGARIETLDGRLRFNPTVFRTDWTDIQTLEAPPGATYVLTSNAGDAQIQGLELESQFAATDNLLFSASFSYLDAKYTRVITNPRAIFPGGFVFGPTGPQGVGIPAITNFVELDSPLPRAPEFKYAVGARYTVPLSSGDSIVANVDYSWVDEQKSISEDIAPLMPSYGLLTGRVQYNSPDGRWNVALFGNNLTNEYYLFGATPYDTGQTAGIRLNEPGAPRTYGVEVGVNF
jgi:iron complex outermembrane recepter protein